MAKIVGTWLRNTSQEIFSKDLYGRSQQIWTLVYF